MSKNVSKQNTMKSARAKQSVAKLKRANEYRRYGGVLGYLMKNYTGVRAFVQEKLLSQKLPADVFLGELSAKFPSIPKEHFPSKKAINDFKKKLISIGETPEGKKEQSLAIVEESKALDALDGLNFFAERVNLYRKARENLDNSDLIVEVGKRVMEQSKMPPKWLFGALQDQRSAITMSDKELTELYKLAVAHGLAQPLPEEGKPMFFQNNNYYEGERVSIQIDEDGKPILDDEKRSNMRTVLQQIFGVTIRQKDMEDMLSKYPRASVVEAKIEEHKSD